MKSDDDTRPSSAEQPLRPPRRDSIELVAWGTATGGEESRRSSSSIVFGVGGGGGGGSSDGNRCAMSRSPFSRSDVPPRSLDFQPSSAVDSGNEESRRQPNRLAAKDMEEAESSEKISLQPLDDLEEAQPQKELTWREKVAAFLGTNRVQWAIIALVIIDCIIVILELLIDIGIIVIPEPHYEVATNGSEHTAYNDHTVAQPNTDNGHHSLLFDPTCNCTVNGTVSNGDHQHSDSKGHGDDNKHAPNRHLIEHILHIASLAILSIFFVEVVAKIIAEGTHLLKHKAEVFDAIVVVVSFTMDITFTFVNVTEAARDYAGLLVLLRLWRFTRIINGVILSVKMDADKKINKERGLRTKAEEQVQRLTDKLDQLTSDNEKLRARIRKLTGKDVTTPSETSVPFGEVNGGSQLEKSNGTTPLEVISTNSDKGVS